MHPARLATVLLLAALPLSACGASDPTSENAAAECEAHIQRYLDSPADTEFDASPEVTLTSQGETDSGPYWDFEVVGSVDIDYRSGGTEHRDYTCTVTQHAGDWVVVDMA
ncbi:hypothetical protein [Nocardiopsis suaedae]|uniref:Lipoprotein n=1 Tax=Nocardiopsis suaedae TaxID=3018444 RepID=A0ABT4TUU0_9ACTN|nr:hypothetical protein [Nocardiopsis suaedae]MDA2807994.1 hypothetical protein [Nocardiopsis suaedae]